MRKNIDCAFLHILNELFRNARLRVLQRDSEVEAAKLNDV